LKILEFLLKSQNDCQMTAKQLRRVMYHLQSGELSQKMSMVFGWCGWKCSRL